MFERLQFEDVLERVVLVLARGTGGCKAFSLVPVEDAADLPNLRMFGPEHLSVALPEDGKWTDLLLSVERRQLYDRVVDEHFSELNHYGPPTLGTVTGANDFFCINEETRLKYAIDERHVARIAPPGTKHFRGLRFTEKDWDRLRDGGDAVWLLLPDPGQLGVGEGDDAGLTRYLKRGVRAGVHKAYKCSIRDPWYRPPMVPAPDLFFSPTCRIDIRV